MSTTVTIEDNNGQVVIVEEQSVVSQRLAVEELEPQTRVVETNVIDEAIVAESPLVNNNQQLYLLVSPLFDVKVAFNVVDGHLIVTYYDLLSKDLGNVVGPQGEQGLEALQLVSLIDVYDFEAVTNTISKQVYERLFNRQTIQGEKFYCYVRDTRNNNHVYLCTAQVTRPSSHDGSVNLTQISINAANKFLITGAKGDTGDDGKDYLTLNEILNVQYSTNTSLPWTVSTNIHIFSFNRTPVVHDELIAILHSTYTSKDYVATCEIMNLSSAYVTSIKVTDISQITGVAGPTALSYGTNMAVTSSTQPDINTQNTFYVNQFNRTPEVNDTFYVAIKNTETLRDYVAYYRVNHIYPYTCTATCYQITLTSSAQPINQFRGEIQESDWTQQGNTYFYTIPRSEHNLINPRVVEYLVESEEDNEQALENAFYSYVVKLSGNIKFISDLPVNVSYMLIGD